MKILKYIFDRPYLVILIAFLIAFIRPGEYAFILLWSILIIFLIFIASIVNVIIQKKWQQLILSFCLTIFFVFTFIIINFFIELNEVFSPRIEIGDVKFYSKEIENSTGLKISKELNILSKIDTIVYIGFEREYDAECLYTGSSKIISELEKQIISKKEFSKVGQISIDQKIKFKDIKSIYTKESDGRYKIYIAFNKNNTKFYYNAFYY
jgi:hypothetical protein